MKRIGIALTLLGVLSCVHAGTARTGYINTMGNMPHKTLFVEGRYWQVRLKYPADIEKLCIETSSDHSAYCYRPDHWIELMKRGAAVGQDQK
jgi:hypothetical protein